MNCQRTVLNLLLFAVTLANCDVISCNGFVKSSSGVDFSKVTVKLLTAQRHQKYSTECNPNGYYMIPVYNKGNYQLKVFAPEGWVFESDTVELKIDGKNDACSRLEDVNFSLSGFTVSGRVRSGGDGKKDTSKGPNQLALGLFNSAGKVISRTQTTERGTYEFKVVPGEYIIKTIDENAQCVERGQVKVVVKDKPITVEEDLKLSGHSLKVHVRDVRKAALPGALVVLTSLTEIPAYENDKKYTAKRENSQWMYSSTTDGTGIVVFKCLPPGKYDVKTTWSDKDVELSFTKNEQNVVMESEPEALEFNASGFSARGSVTINGRPVKDAVINVNNKESAKSNENGLYVLRDLSTSKQYTISATLENYEFNNVKMTFQSPQDRIPPITAKSVKICGHVQLEEKHQTLVLGFTNEATKETQELTLDQAGQFCFMLSPVRYAIKPLWQIPKVTPHSVSVDARNGPVLSGVRFTQFRGKISGKVMCSSGTDMCSKVGVELRKNDEVLQKSTGTTFVFNDVSPDDYKVYIADGSRLCWETNVQDVKLELSNVDNIVFLQSGFELRIDASHEANLQWQHKEEKSVRQSEMTLASGRNVFCVPKQGTYLLKLSSCHVFDVPTPLTYSTGSEPLSLKSDSVQHSASIITSHSVDANNFVLLLKGQNTTKLGGISDNSRKNHSFVFFIQQNQRGSEFELIPQSEIYLFKPSKQRFTFDGACKTNLAKFSAEIGQYVTGRILPSVANVHVKAVHKQNSNDVLKAETDSDGKFKMGPVWNEQEYAIEVSKEGYEFTPSQNKNEFKALKLSELKISFLDAQSKKPLSDVLVSLSNTENYRSNSVIDQTGTIRFIGLAPGKYYVRPILQEYRFEEAQRAPIEVNVKEGKIEELTVFGTRFAYSAIGKVTTINGSPIEAVHVEAISEKCGNLMEEDTTKKHGGYRVRGLQPNCLYQLALKREDGSPFSSYPPLFNIMTAEADQMDLNFVVLPVSSGSEVMGTVVFDKVQPPSSYHLQLQCGGNVVQEAVLQSPSTIFFFSNLSLEQADCLVVVDHADLQKFKLESTPLPLKIDNAFKFVKVHVRSERRHNDVEVSKSSYVGLFLIIVLTLAFLNQSKIKPTVERLAVIINNINTGRGNYANDVDGEGRRRRAKRT